MAPVTLWVMWGLFLKSFSCGRACGACRLVPPAACMRAGTLLPLAARRLCQVPRQTLCHAVAPWLPWVQGSATDSWEGRVGMWLASALLFGVTEVSLKAGPGLAQDC